MSLTVLSWNSQGDKSDAMWTDPRFQAEMGIGNDVLLFVCEAGTPDWITPGLPKIPEGHTYTFTRGLDPSTQGTGGPAPWFNSVSPGQITKDIATYNQTVRKREDKWEAYWIPWQVYVNVPPSLRCSVSLYWFPAKGTKRTATVAPKPLVTHAYAGRPVFTVETQIKGTKCVLLFGHLPAGYTSAQVALPELATLAGQVIPSGSAIMIMGDLNINATNDATLAKVMDWMGFYASLSGEQTQNSGGQLDWGCYNELMGRIGIPAKPTLVWRCNKDKVVAAPTLGPSDHAMLKWVFA